MPENVFKILAAFHNEPSRTPKQPRAQVVVVSGRRKVARVLRLGVSDCGEFTAVAGVTIHRRTCISSADVTAGTLSRGMYPGQSEPSFAMVENGALPLRRRVTQLAVLWECGRDVVWIRSRCELAQMTRNARGVE